MNKYWIFYHYVDKGSYKREIITSYHGYINKNKKNPDNTISFSFEQLWLNVTAQIATVLFVLLVRSWDENSLSIKHEHDFKS